MVIRDAIFYGAKHMRGIISVLFSKDTLLKNESKDLCRSRCIVSVVLCVAAALMLVMNIKNHATMMSFASIVLVVGFAISAFVAGVLRKETLSAIIIAGLVPLFAINILGVVSGLGLSVYFLLFLFVLFKTPLCSLVQDKYTVSF